ncbi:SGNH/GDSL hydrolase family protein [Chlorogloeopsis sp. ULAP02]|uniref:SGNH/GDSL hydrolase family protein n=1 Tax=Chlorogloeopsis sp. ULAP02 TaxID=3107926 RepID=UPI0031362B52
MKKYRKYILTTALFLLLYATLSPKVSEGNLIPYQKHQSQYQYDKIYIFGDSLTDVGNIFNTTGGIIPPSPTYFNGRFSNGSVWVEYLTSNLRLGFNPNTNFAFGGATTSFKNLLVPGLPGLQQQINRFRAANPSTYQNSLYILWAGLNDYLDYFLGGTPNPAQTAKNLSTVVKLLTDVGAKEIILVNLPDLGKFPFTGHYQEISSLFSNFTKAHNSILMANIQSLKQDLSPEINIITVDVNSLFNRAFTNPEEFGFTNVTDSCITKDVSVVNIGHSTRLASCNPNKFLFWDPIHPTTATHKLIADLVFSVFKSASIHK